MRDYYLFYHIAIHFSTISVKFKKIVILYFYFKLLKSDITIYP